MNRAAELLMSQDSNVGDVASEVGYSNVFHFSRLFKKRFGDSPRNFRKGLVATERDPKKQTSGA